MTEFKAPYPGAPNEIMTCDGFVISYNSAREINPLDTILVAVGILQKDNFGRDETAIVIPDKNKRTGRKHLILYGDHRTAYQKIVAEGLNSCLTFFSANIEQMTDTSDSLETSLH